MEGSKEQADPGVTCPAAPHHPASKGWGSLGWTQLGWPWVQSWERQDSPLPSHSTHRSVHRGLKAAGSEIQGHGVAGGDKPWKRSLGTEVGVYLDMQKNYREYAVK